MTFELLPHGVVLFRQALTAEVQISLLQHVISLIDVDGKVKEAQNPDRRYIQLLMWNWPGRYGAMVADDACSVPPELPFTIAGELLGKYRESPVQVVVHPPSFSCCLNAPSQCRFCTTHYLDPVLVRRHDI